MALDCLQPISQPEHDISKSMLGNINLAREQLVTTAVAVVDFSKCIVIGHLHRHNSTCG